MKKGTAHGDLHRLTAVETKGFSGNTWPALLDLFQEIELVERSGMSSWDDKFFVAAVKKTGRKNHVIAALRSGIPCS